MRWRVARRARFQRRRPARSARDRASASETERPSAIVARNSTMAASKVPTKRDRGARSSSRSQSRMEGIWPRRLLARGWPADRAGPAASNTSAFSTRPSVQLCPQTRPLRVLSSRPEGTTGPERSMRRPGEFLRVPTEGARRSPRRCESPGRGRPVDCLEAQRSNGSDRCSESRLTRSMVWAWPPVRRPFAPPLRCSQTKMSPGRSTGSSRRKLRMGLPLGSR